MRRRWTAGDTGNVTDASGRGIRWRVVSGTKFPEDLVIEIQTPSGWWRPPMALAFLLDDFFGENERLRRHLDPTVSTRWKEEGDRYYAKRVWKAITDGWQAPANETRRDRDRTEPRRAA